MDHRLNRIRDDAYRKGFEDGEQSRKPTTKHVSRLIDAIEGELDGLCIDYQTAEAIMLHVFGEEGDGSG